MTLNTDHAETSWSGPTGRVYGPCCLVDFSSEWPGPKRWTSFAAHD